MWKWSVIVVICVKANQTINLYMYQISVAFSDSINKSEVKKNSKFNPK